MRRRERAFAMIEVVMATAIVGGLTVGALTLVGSVSKQKASAAELSRGQVLCRSLAEEIATRPVTDWDEGGLDIAIAHGGLTITGIGAKPIVVVVGGGNRSTFETVDKYKNYTESPPKDEDGNTLAGYTGWRRTVKVAPVTVADPSSTSAVETGLRCVTVTALYNGKTVASTTFLRSSEWERVQP